MIEDNAEKALMKACQETGATIREYTAGPQYMSTDSKGAHEWMIEFDSPPDSLEEIYQDS